MRREAHGQALERPESGPLPALRLELPIEGAELTTLAEGKTVSILSPHPAGLDRWVRERHGVVEKIADGYEQTVVRRAQGHDMSSSRAEQYGGQHKPDPYGETSSTPIDFGWKLQNVPLPAAAKFVAVVPTVRGVEGAVEYTQQLDDSYTPDPPKSVEVLEDEYLLPNIVSHKIVVSVADETEISGIHLHEAIDCGESAREAEYLALQSAKEAVGEAYGILFCLLPLRSSSHLERVLNKLTTSTARIPRWCCVSYHLRGAAAMWEEGGRVV